MNDTLRILLIICPLVFTAGFIDSIAGGGGLISLPAYLFAGLPVHFAYGTNKFAMSFGTFFAAARFVKSKQIHVFSAAVSALTALLGSFLGAKAALAMDEKYLKYCLMIILPLVAIFVLTRKGFGEADRAVDMPKSKIVVYSAGIGFAIGLYDGFIGPGTGTFLMLAYTGIIGFNLITSTGNAKIVNLASNVAAVATFLAGGKILFIIGIPAAVSSILGNWIGSGLAIKNGAKVIRPVFICVLTLLFLKMGYDLVR